MSDLITDEEVRELANKPAGRCLIRKDHTYLPFLSISGDKETRMIRVNRKQLTLLHHLKDGLSIAEACDKAGLTETQALYFLKKQDVQAWLRNKAEQQAVLRDWTPEKWFDWGQKVLDAPEGMEIPKSKIEVWREFGDRCVPKPSRNGESATSKIEITIDAAAVHKAFLRRDAIEAQIVSQEKAA